MGVVRRHQRIRRDRRRGPVTLRFAFFLLTSIWKQVGVNSMALTFANLKLHASHSTTIDSTTLPPGTTADAAAGQIVNTAGQLLYNAWPWKFRERPPARLDFTAPIVITDATWTESTKTLTKTGGFTNYTFAASDVIAITGGTGATTGNYTIISRVSDDAIVLSTSIGSAADGNTDIDGEIGFPYVDLPSDFGELIEIRADGLTADFTLTDVAELAMLRDSAVRPAGFMYWGTIVQPAQASQTKAMGVPRLEIYPTPTAALVSALTLWYRAVWRELILDTHYAAIPQWCEALLIEYIRAVAEGYMNRHADNEGILPVVTTSDRIRDIEDGPIFKRATEKDMLIQSSYGVLDGGLIGSLSIGHPSVVRVQDVYSVSRDWIN